MGFLISRLITKYTSAINRAYADANSIAQHALSNIRTVYAFNGEARTIAQYEEALEEPVKVCVAYACEGE
jgi:ATP-binding cassette subfamily B (MDR/TAP) protein 1